MLGTVLVGKNTPMLVCMIYVGSLFFLFLSKLFASLHVCLATKKMPDVIRTHTIDRYSEPLLFLKKKVVPHTKKKKKNGRREMIKVSVAFLAMADCLVEFLQQRETERINTTKRALSR